MKHSRLWLAAAIIAFVIVGGFALSVPHTRDIVESKALSTANSSIPVVALRDVFKKGVHTITGSIEVSTACTTVSAQAASSTESILLEISLLSDTGVCLQLPTLVTFSTTLAAPAALPLVVTVNGARATTTML